MRKYTGVNVLDAAKERINFVFDNFNKIYLSFSAGKDSTAMFHLVIDEAIKRNIKIGILFIDWECQFEHTINHAKSMFEKYKEHIDLYWIQLEIMTNNASSMLEPTWKSFDEDKKGLWVREKEKNSINQKEYFDFYYDNITFEEFIGLFGEWYSKGENTACFVGIRAQESLNRFRAIARDDVARFKEKKYTVKSTDCVYNVYPIYDWKCDDVWTFVGKHKLNYNKIYDLMHGAGLSIHQMRIDEPFGDEARKNLWIYHVIEPKTWAKMVSRMEGVNSGSLYSKENGNILGNLRIKLPNGHTWESFSKSILDTIPPKTAEHYKNKIAVYIKWYKDRGYADGIPDEADYRLEQLGKVPAWRQIAKTLLKNDYWCRTLGFGITKSSAYDNYLKLMKKRRANWGIFN
jgi:predicted phosphoadenosine phosphosulfate sulfurtransferase